MEGKFLLIHNNFKSWNNSFSSFKASTHSPKCETETLGFTMF